MNLRGWFTYWMCRVFGHQKNPFSDGLQWYCGRCFKLGMYEGQVPPKAPPPAPAPRP